MILEIGKKYSITLKPSKGKLGERWVQSGTLVCVLVPNVKYPDDLLRKFYNGAGYHRIQVIERFCKVNRYVFMKENGQFFILPKPTTKALKEV